MDLEGKKEEEERRKKEEETKRRAKMKRWLGTRKEKLRERKTISNMQGLGLSSPGEGGIHHPDVLEFEQHPDDNSLLRGRECRTSFTRERGPGVEGGMGVVTETDDVIYERPQPKKTLISQHLIIEQHLKHGTDLEFAVNGGQVEGKEK